MKKLPGIFNDVIGPVMRGPSSSHTAASWRIARLGLDILNQPLKKALAEFDREGAWAPNFREQGTTMGIEGGLLGMEITDERLKTTEYVAREKGISIEYQVTSFPVTHANTVRLTLWGETGKKIRIIAVSLGGGAFEIRSVNEFPVLLNGELYALLIFAKNNPGTAKAVKEMFSHTNEFSAIQREEVTMYEVKSSYPFLSDQLLALKNYPEIDEISVIQPIMPVIAGREKEMPFDTIGSLIAFSVESGADLSDLGLEYEKCLSGLSEEELMSKMSEVVQIIRKSIETGLHGTRYEDRILPQQSHLIGKAEKEGRIKPSVTNQIVAYVSALMESKSAMELIVAAPTAGSCGALGGALQAFSEYSGSSENDLVKAYFAAGIVGAYFARGPGFSAEEYGCQVECGAASGMAAAALAQLMGGTAQQAIGAASLAIQNMIGMICDPVADRVEVPCLGKNINAAVNAYASAIMAVSGYDPVIPLDEVIQTVSEVGKSMPPCVKCTGHGGLAITGTALTIKNKLKGYKLD